MEALRAWRASSNLLGFAASRAAKAAPAARPLRPHVRCCSPAAASTTKPPPPPPQDRRRRSASSSSSTSDRESIRAIRLKKVLLLANPFLLPQSVFDTAIRLIGINRLCRVVC